MALNAKLMRDCEDDRDRDEHHWKCRHPVFRKACHEVIQVGRTSGETQADLTDIDSLRTMFSAQAPFDAVANAAGEVFPSGLESAEDDQWARSTASKGTGRINVVRAGLPHISDGGSFTLVSGILDDEITNSMTIGTTINRMVEGFVQGPRPSCRAGCGSIV